MNNDLEYLMTSEFNEGLSPDELKEWLIKFRYEYRLLSSKNSSLIKEIEKYVIITENEKEIKKEIIYKNNNKISFLDEEIFNLKSKLNRKLTLKERITGKINRYD